MPLLTRRRAAMVLALPAFLVPAIEIPLVLWARHAFLSANGETLEDPATISLAISDPAIGGIFANIILVIAALVLTAMPVIVWAYLAAIARLPASAGRRHVMWALLGFFCIGQIVATAGLVLTTQYTFSNGHDLHMLGSYIFFPAQALALLAAAVLCRMLLGRQQAFGIGAEAWPFRPGMHRFRFRFALVMIFFAVSFGVLFVIKDWPLPLHPETVHLLYTQSEVLVVICYLLFFGSYSLDILEMVREGRLHPRLGSPEPPAAVAGDGETLSAREARMAHRP